jgi:hypothetical protein
MKIIFYIIFIKSIKKKNEEQLENQIKFELKEIEIIKIFEVKS